MAYEAENTSQADLKKAAEAAGVDSSGTKEEVAARLNTLESGATAPVADPATVEAAAAQYQEDLDWKTAHPNEPLIRASNPEVGGEG